MEGKNASVVGKIYGYSHIPQQYAKDFHALNSNFLYRYISFHRPSYFPTTVIDKNGKQKKQCLYENMMTPCEKLKSLPNAEDYLKSGITFKKRDEYSLEMTDNETAKQLYSARNKLFQRLHERLKVGSY